MFNLAACSFFGSSGWTALWPLLWRVVWEQALRLLSGGNCWRVSNPSSYLCSFVGYLPCFAKVVWHSFLQSSAWNFDRTAFGANTGGSYYIESLVVSIGSAKVGREHSDQPAACQAAVQGLLSSVHGRACFLSGGIRGNTPGRDWDFASRGQQIAPEGRAVGGRRSFVSSFWDELSCGLGFSER